MPHPIDRQPVDKKAVNDLRRAYVWHHAINDRLEKKGHRPEPMFNKAIREGQRLNVVSDNTARMADKIRHKANDARHKF